MASGPAGEARNVGVKTARRACRKVIAVACSIGIRMKLLVTR
jgi:hypothetical protein